MKIGFFGQVGELIGREVEVDAARVGTVGDLRDRLAAQFPAAASHLRTPRLKALVDDRAVGDDHGLDGVERVEFFPPLSGG